MNIEIVKETRFAVVMYGGVSLAIYINGVAQELLRMVRATAVEDDGARFRVSDEKLTATELIYRDLAYLIADKDLIEDKNLLEQYCSWLKNRRTLENPLTAKLKERKADGKNIKVARFIVDILSGSSAGGINGVYMAKALVGGQSLDALEELWCSEGDFVKLLNDEKSIVDEIDEQTSRQLGLENQNPPLSLLNSQRMYLKLLTAFDRMDDGESIAEPFVDEVDLFVTMTDYWGIPVPIRLFDQLIHERRHRQNLHFRFRKDDDLNEFVEKLYPFLAFSARCTSSFPLAFDPMQIKTANQIIEQVKKQHAAGRGGENLRHDPIAEELWKRSFKPTTVQDVHGEEIAIEWDKRVFVDGGYLDNKPFGYAIAALAQKQSDVLVDRKLIYVEPEPDVDDSRERANKITPPLALENTLAALTDMPRYETIREDLQEVLQRNRLITRVNQIVTNARKDELDSLRFSFENPDNLNAVIGQHKNLIAVLIDKYRDSDPSIEEKQVKWEKLSLGEIAQQKGQIAYPYYRLRVAALTDNLARMVTHRAGYDEDSDYFLAVRDLVHTWRKKRYRRGEESDTGNRKEDVKVPTPLLFLRDFDFDYRLRRLRFVLQQADRLLQFDGNLRNELEKMKEIAEELREAVHPAQPFTADEKKALQTRFSLVEIEIYDRATHTPSEIILEHRGEKLRQTVRSFKKAVNDILREFRRDLRQVQPNTVLDPENPNKDLIETLNRQVSEVAKEIQIVDLEFLLGKAEGRETQLDARNDLDARRMRAEEFLADRKEIKDELNVIGETLKTIYNGNEYFSVFGKSRKQIHELFNADASDLVEQRKVQARLQMSEPDEIYLAVRAYLSHFYDNFDAYDQIIFPVTYETPIGEAAIIDVARISPLDAPSLINEVEERRVEMLDAADPRLSEKEKRHARRKVAGGTFRAFGAFFAEDWRKNDILWGRLDAVERLVSIVLNNNLITKTSELQAKPLRNSLGKVRTAIIKELHETILQESGLITTYYEKYLAQNPSAKKFDRLDFVKYEYTVERKLPKTGVFRTTARSLAILRKVFRKDEFGKFNQPKDVALDGLGLIVKQNPERGERRMFLKPFLPTSYLIFGVLIFLSPLLIFAAAVLLSILFPSIWFLIGGLAATTLIYAIVLWYGNHQFNKLWKRLKLFLENMVYSKVTGVERK